MHFDSTEVYVIMVMLAEALSYCENKYWLRRKYEDVEYKI